MPENVYSTIGKNLQAVAMNQYNMDLTKQGMMPEIAKQGALAGFITSNIMPALHDENNPMNPKLALSNVIKEANRLGVAPDAALNLFNSVAQTLSQQSQKSGMSFEQMLAMRKQEHTEYQASPEGIMETETTKMGVKEGVPVMRQALAGLATKLLGAKSSFGDNPTVEQIIDKLSESGDPYEVSGKWFIPYLNRFKDMDSLASAVTKKIMEIPEIARTWGGQEQTMLEVIKQVLKGEKSADEAIESVPGISQGSAKRD